MKLSAPIFRLKRLAKAMAGEQNMSLNLALDRVAQSEGAKSWSHLALSHSNQSRSEKILNWLTAGDLMLLGARPGQGKTLLGLELAYHAAIGRAQSLFFTLEYNEEDVTRRMHDLRLDITRCRGSLTIDTSNKICADHVIEKLAEFPQPTVAVIDYLQLLDQNRNHPPLGEQVRSLRNFAKHSGAIIILISQIDRAFEMTGLAMPRLADVRQPNQLDLGLFGKTCFLHEGEIELRKAA